MIGLAFRIFLPFDGSSCTLMPKPYESANDGRGLPQAAANGFTLGVGTGTGVGVGTGAVGVEPLPPQAGSPAIRRTTSAHGLATRFMGLIGALMPRFYNRPDTHRGGDDANDCSRPRRPRGGVHLRPGPAPGRSGRGAAGREGLPRDPGVLRRRGPQAAGAL